MYYKISLLKNCPNGDYYSTALVSFDDYPQIHHKERILFLIKSNTSDDDKFIYNLFVSEVDELLKKGYSENFAIEPFEIFTLSW